MKAFSIFALALAACFVAAASADSETATSSSTHTPLVLIDGRVTPMPNGDSLTIATGSANDQVLNINGPWTNQVSVTDAQGEIFTQTLTGTDHSIGGDVCGVVVRNHVDFDVTAGPNQSCAVYGETTATRSHGANALINYGVRGKATGGTENYGLFCDAGKVRCDDGAQLGPIITTGNFQHTLGTFAIGGTTTINGATTITNASASAFVSAGGGEFAGNLTADANFRCNGNSNLDGGGSSKVFMHSVDVSSVPLEITNSLALAPERLSGSGAASPILGNTIVTGSGTALTLADGTKDGETKSFSIKSGTGTITPAHLNGGTVYTWSTAPASLILMWDLSATKWVEVAMRNMVLT